VKEPHIVVAPESPAVRTPCLFVVLASLIFAVTGCETAAERNLTLAQRRGVDAVLAGEWVLSGSSDEYLLFKPERGERGGRFGGIKDFDRYRITSRLLFGHRVYLQLLSATADTDQTKLPVTIDFASDGHALYLTLPSKRHSKSPEQRLYLKANY
jgi:hypothetical protein